jgi:glycosyltransferase involved in cell wall biosynthesis
MLSSVSDAQLGFLYRECSGVIVASDAEGFCLPACEAVAHGKTVIAPESGAIREATRGVCVFYEPGNMPGLASAIGTLCSNPPLSVSPVDVNWSDAVKEFREALTTV